MMGARAARHCVLLGAFPPPVGGAAKNNALLYEALTNRGADVRRIDTSTTKLSHSRSLRYHLHRLYLTLMAGLRLLAASGSGAVLYLVPDGGLGVWYSLFHVCLSRPFYQSLVIHHRTCLYIDRKSGAMAWLVKVAGPKARHIFLSDEMSDRFRLLYGAVDSRVISNATYVFDSIRNDPETTADGAAIDIGHLSNLCTDKGFFLVADTFDLLLSRGADVVLHIAGPILEDAVQSRLTELQTRAPDRVRYYGPLSGDEKAQFYRRLNVFLFPTLFRQEAAPNVVFESLAAGVPVFANLRGCLREMLADGRGVIVEADQSFPEIAADGITGMDFSPQSINERSRRITASLTSECQQASQAYGELLDLLETGR